MLGRKTLKSERARMQRVDTYFRRTAQTFLILYMAFVFGVWFTHRPSFFLTTIIIEGTHALPAPEMHRVAEQALHTHLLFLINRNNKFLYPSHEVLTNLKTLYPRIANITLGFDNSHEARIVVTEYAPAMLYCTSLDSFIQTSAPSHVNASSTSGEENMGEKSPATLSDCYFADERGYVFASAPEYAGFPFVAIVAPKENGEKGRVPIGTFALDIEKYKSIQSFIAALETLGFKTHAVELLAEHDVRIKTDKPWDILWTTTKDPLESTKNLKLVLASFDGSKKQEGELNVVDLRFGNKIFYK